MQSDAILVASAAAVSTLQYVFPGKAFFFEPEKGSIVAGITRFAAAALPKSPICALKLGDKTSITAAIYGLFAGLKRARCSTAAMGEVLGGAQGVMFLGLAPSLRARQTVFSRVSF
jgi:hypothetical protein